jgi:hypothetical protein
VLTADALCRQQPTTMTAILCLMWLQWADPGSLLTHLPHLVPLLAWDAGLLVSMGRPVVHVNAAEGDVSS